MINIKWVNDTWNEDHPATSEQVEAIENKFNIRYPIDYVDFAKLNQGKAPEICGVPVGSGESMLTTILNFENKPDEESYFSSIIGKHELITDENYDALIIPFAETGGASIFCFDYRESKDKPSIIFLDWDYFGDGDEEAIILVAKDFTEFLSLLKE